MHSFFGCQTKVGDSVNYSTDDGVHKCNEIYFLHACMLICNAADESWIFSVQLVKGVDTKFLVAYTSFQMLRITSGGAIQAPQFIYEQ